MGGRGMAAQEPARKNEGLEIFQGREARGAVTSGNIMNQMLEKLHRKQAYQAAREADMELAIKKREIERRTRPDVQAAKKRSSPVRSKHSRRSR